MCLGQASVVVKLGIGTSQRRYSSKGVALTGSQGQGELTG